MNSQIGVADRVIPNVVDSLKEDNNTLNPYKRTVEKKRSFQVIIESNGSTCIGDQCNLADDATFPQTFTSSFDDSEVLSYDTSDEEKPREYDLQVEIDVGSRPDRFLVVDKPKSRFGLESPVSRADKLIFNNNMMFVYDILAVQLPKVDGEVVIYIVHNGVMGQEIILEVPNKWSAEGLINDRRT